MPVGMHQGQPCRPVLLCHWLGETLPGIHLQRVVVIPELRELNTIFSDSQSGKLQPKQHIGFSAAFRKLWQHFVTTLYSEMLLGQ